MKRQQVDQFFAELSKQWSHLTRILLVGGAGALVMGGVRPTLDVDFEVQFLSKQNSWDLFQEAVRAATQKVGIEAQYAESIERWSSVTLGDYRNHVERVGTYGKLEVCVLDPEYWSIGKMARYWDQDVQDMIAVFKRRKPDPMKLAQIWTDAIRHSPKSTQLMLAKKQALHFFKTFGEEIWGDSLSLERIQGLF